MLPSFLKSKFIWFVLVIIAGGSAYYLFSPKQSTGPSYLTQTVVNGDLNQTIIATGTVRSNDRVEVGAQISGQLEKIYVTLGEHVKKGQLIAKIDSKTQQNALETAKSQLKSVQSQLKAAQITLSVAESAYDRNLKLYRLKTITLNAFNEYKESQATAQANVDKLESEVTQAKISVETAQTNLSYTTISSPIDGTIISIPVSTGQTINANQVAPTIVQIADLKTMLIKAEISEADITQLQPGMKVEFTTLANPNTIYHATINSIDPGLTTLTDNEYTESVSDTAAVYYYANIIVPNPKNQLRIGMTTQDTITVSEHKNVLLIPKTAIINQNGKTFVRVLNANQQVEKRAVELGNSDDINIIVKSGLNVGEKIIIAEAIAGEKTKIPGDRGMRL